MTYLHGIETVEYKVGQRAVVEVRSAVVGIVGTAPDNKIPPRTLTVFAGEEDAKNKLGDPVDGFTVWKALKAIFDHENTTVLFVNAYNSSVHTSPSSVNSTDIISAMSEFDKAFTEFGFTPKILIAPGFSQDPAVALELASRAKKYRGIAIADIPDTIDPLNLLAYKQASNLSDTHLILTYPQVKLPDGSKGWLSERLAGLFVWNDKNKLESYGAIPSNDRIEGVLGPTKNLTYYPNDPNTEVQQVNAQGVYTIMSFLGRQVGFGTRTSAFPALTHPADTLINWVRVGGIIDETLEINLVQFLDKIMFYSPESALRSVISDIEDTINDYLRTLQNRGVLIYKEARIDREKTTLQELLKGRVHYYLEPIPGVPIEGIVLHRVMNSDRVAEVFKKLFQS